VADEVNQVIDDAPRGRRLIHGKQLRDSAGAIAANISEGYGRGEGLERKRSLRVARGEAEETIRHLRANLRRQRLPERAFWRLTNRLITIIKMLTSIIHRNQDGRWAADLAVCRRCSAFGCGVGQL
jgi:four helix bundle protein